MQFDIPAMKNLNLLSETLASAMKTALCLLKVRSLGTKDAEAGECW